MIDLIDTIVQRLNGGERIALCVLVRARGSTPQSAGAAMLVLANGQTLGTLGGGCVEAEVRTRALRSLHGDGGPQLASFKLDHDFGWDDGLMCGGTMDVSVQVFAAPSDAEPLLAVRDALRRKQSSSYAIQVPNAMGQVQPFEVPFVPRPTLLIAGGGHVGQAIASLAAGLDFDVAVLDDRADVLSPERFPTAQRVIGPIEQELARLRIDAHTFVVIVTRGHRNDAAALSAVIRSPAAYIGMIGSKRKVRAILDGLMRDGVPRDRLFAVRAPIGLSIGALAPAEIAVSVCAELIAVRRRHEGAIEPLQMPRDELTRWFDRDSLGG